MEEEDVVFGVVVFSGIVNVVNLLSNCCLIVTCPFGKDHWSLAQA